MKTDIKDEFDLEMLNKARSRNEGLFHRTTDEDHEVVKYLGDSTIRIWYNMEDESFPIHWHFAIEVIIPIENIYTVKTQKGDFILTPGDIMVIPAGELHELVAPPSGSRIICLFDYSVISSLSGFSSLSPFLSQFVIIKQDDASPIYNREISLIKQMVREYADQNSFFELVIYSRLLSFLVTIGRYKLMGDKNTDDFDSAKQKELSKKLSIAFEYIDSHYTEDVSLDDVAQVAGFSKFHFSRLFKQCSGQNFHEYLCYKRIKASEILLLKPELSITEIAFQAGFASLSTFNRTFKTINQCSPTEYRNLCSKSPDRFDYNAFN